MPPALCFVYTLNSRTFTGGTRIAGDIRALAVHAAAVISTSNNPSKAVDFLTKVFVCLSAGSIGPAPAHTVTLSGGGRDGHDRCRSASGCTGAGTAIRPRSSMHIQTV
jgi:hypothetical protein